MKKSEPDCCVLVHSEMFLSATVKSDECVRSIEINEAEKPQMMKIIM